jgi:undecaprenyl-diphosphatase
MSVRTFPSFNQWTNLFSHYELHRLVWLAFILIGCWGFIGLAEEVMEGETRALDKLLLLGLRNPADISDPIGPHWLEEVMRDFTALGGYAVLILWTVAVVGYLLLQRQAKTALLVIFAIGGGALLNNVLKLGFDRPRPDLVPHEVMVYTASFPSGHAMLSAIVYLTLGALLMRTEPKRRLKAYIFTLTVLLTFLVGISRVYLGVHWPTDVLAGWAAGATWALICWIVMRRLQQRGNVDACD